jgi:hypothetical protein
MESHDGMILTGENRRNRRKTCPSATLSTTNLTWTDLGANLGLRGEATNRLSPSTPIHVLSFYSLDQISEVMASIMSGMYEYLLTIYLACACSLCTRPAAKR